MTQTYNNCAETNLGGGVMSPLSPRVRHRSSARSNCHRQYSSPERPTKFCPHHSDCCRALMLTCRNSHLWQRCEHCNNVLSSSWPPSLDQLNSVSSRDMCVNLTTLEYELVDANRGIQKARVEPATRSAVATCYTPGRGKIVPRNVTLLVGEKLCRVMLHSW